MKTVIIAGAGATLSQAMSLRSTRRRQHPPLDNNFFHCAEQLGIANRAIRGQIARLRKRVGWANAFPDPFQSPRPGMEQFFADVYYHVASDQSSQAFEVFRELLRLYNLVLGATTNWLGTHQRLGALDRALRLHVQNADEEVTVVTFNHDLLLENIAFRLPRQGHRWCLHSLYGIKHRELKQVTGGNNASFPIHEDGCAHAPPFRLLKLHGSLNWVTRTLAEYPSRSTLFPTNDAKDVFVYEDRVARDRLRLQQGGGGRSNWYLWPVVVPPIYEKSRMIGRRMIQQMWRDAHKAISQADRLLLVGYSLPDADVIALQMLRRAFSENDSLYTVDCVNPDPGVVQKLKQRLGCRIVHLYDDVLDYVEEHEST